MNYAQGHVVTENREEWIGGRGFTCKCGHRGSQHLFVCQRIPGAPPELTPVLTSICLAPGCRCKGFREDKRRYVRAYRNGAHSKGANGRRGEDGKFVRWFGEDTPAAGSEAERRGGERGLHSNR
jgi:hypothetical protein